MSPSPEIQTLPVLSRRSQGRYRDERTGESLLSLVELGEAVLDEHRAALEHERDVTSPAKLAAALTANDRVKELIEELL